MLISIDSTSSDVFILIKVNFYETSQNCLDADFKSGSTSLQLSDTSSFTDRKYVRIYEFPRENAGTIPSCMQGTCNFQLTISWKSQVQYIFKIITTIEVNNFAVTNIFEFHDLPVQVIDVVCTDCIIPASQIEPSTLELACADGQICTSDSIAAEIGSMVTFTQKVSSEDLADATIIPHSLRIDMTSYGSTNSIYIKQQEFNNDTKGQITYSFATITVSQGTLTATSYIQKNNRMLLLSSLVNASKVKYPQSQIGIEITDGKVSSAMLRVIIGGSLLAVVAMAVGIIVLIKRNRRLSKRVIDLKNQESFHEEKSLRIPEPNNQF